MVEDTSDVRARASHGEVDDDQSYGPHLLEGQSSSAAVTTTRDWFCAEETLLHVSGPAPGRAVGAATQPGAWPQGLTLLFRASAELSGMRTYTSAASSWKASSSPECWCCCQLNLGR